MIQGLISGVADFLKSPFNRYLVVGLLLLGAFALFAGLGEQPLPQGKEFTVHVFYLPTCPHCAEQKPIINELSQEMANVSFVMYDASTPEGSALFYSLASEAGLDISRLGVPTTFVGKKALVGVHSKQEIMAEIINCQTNCAKEKSETESYQPGATALKEFDVPFIGRTDLTTVSLPLLAIILGLIDGFNPCAMWVLVYLIGLLLEVNDKKKAWVIVGCFVLASGILYFLFMTAWLNAFLLIGYVRAITILIGVIALGGGVVSLKEYFTTKGALACKVGDEESHEKTVSRMRDIVLQPLTIPLVISIVTLAFVVNSIEFVCSSAIPAVFTQVLALNELPTMHYYAYIALYDIFFTLDLVILGVLTLAFGSMLGEKYAKYCKLIGGVIMAALGLIMLFAPQLLR
jgi:thiol-disulfide isomerase/thioredoxin